MPFRLSLLLALALTSGSAIAQSGLTAFASDAELAAYLDSLRQPVRVARPAAPAPPATEPATPPAPTVTCAASDDAAVRVEGRVLDADLDQPLPGANVLVVGGEGCGAATDVEGAFVLALPAAEVAAGGLVLRASYAGYETQEAVLPATATGELAVDITLSAADLQLSEVVVTGVASQSSPSLSTTSITNVQTAGVDEGGIVKRLGDHLVVLRRGRLFTVDVSGGELLPIDAVDASGPDIDPRGTWYDELLIVGETAVVVGYSYERGGTEIGLFDVGRRGRMAYRGTYHLRSNDYYSAENYASRVVDGRLVFYAPLSVRGRTIGDLVPGLRRWEGEGTGDFEPIASATQIYRPARALDARNLALHTVTTCEIADGQLDCDATAVFGPFSHTFYVSGTAVYAWLSSWGRQTVGRAPSMLYRLPLDGGTPGAIGVEGGPIDQFSFLESGDTLNVVVGRWGGGQWMWRSERPRHQLALARLPLDQINGGAEDAVEAWYHPLAVPEGGVDVNRFVGDHVLYGSSRVRGDASVLAVDWTRPGTVHRIPLGHATERVEVLGAHAVVVGSGDGDLHVSTVRLGAVPEKDGHVRLPDMAQGETRSHGFFYRPTGAERGTIGLPVRRWGGRYASLRHGSASIAYLRNWGLSLQRLGELAASRGVPDDGCKASCVDWYGNARPLFFDGRVFALLGYELVEGEIRGWEIEEVDRVSFAPPRRLTAR